MKSDFGNLPETRVSFRTEDETLQRLYDLAEKQILLNRKDFAGMPVLIEGEDYTNVWLETQPMGGQMYAKRNVELGLNNQLIFMKNARKDGRLPGFVKMADGAVTPQYHLQQGYCFPYHALKMADYLEDETPYLTWLYEVLKNFDAYLWRNRDSDGDGCLESWCVWDTGEDNCTRFGNAPEGWDGEVPPEGFDTVPIESMDFMGYSHDGRYTLAKISERLQNGMADFWYAEAEKVRDKVASYLWIDEKHAAFDRNSKNRVMDILIHNNLRAMYYGVFRQSMADAFIKYHLFNPDEFWTPFPLPSIAANDKMFRNIPVNNWSGPSQGLTYQRTIRALENYGHYAEVPLVGQKLIENLEKQQVFTQQYDPFTGAPGQRASGKKSGSGTYGPTILAFLEYVMKLYGVEVTKDYAAFSAWGKGIYTYRQTIGERTWELQSTGDRFCGLVDEKEVFSCTSGVRVVTDDRGAVQSVIGISEAPISCTLEMAGKTSTFLVLPNHVYDASGTVLQKTAFDYPYQKDKEL